MQYFPGGKEKKQKNSVTDCKRLCKVVECGQDHNRKRGMGNGISKTSGPQEAGNGIKTEEYTPPKALFAQGFPASCVPSQGVIA